MKSCCISAQKLSENSTVLFLIGEEGYLKQWVIPSRTRPIAKLEVGIRSELERQKTAK